jgi:hypothetical protein
VGFVRRAAEEWEARVHAQSMACAIDIAKCSAAVSTTSTAAALKFLPSRSTRAQISTIASSRDRACAEFNHEALADIEAAAAATVTCKLKLAIDRHDHADDPMASHEIGIEHDFHRNFEFEYLLTDIDRAGIEVDCEWEHVE